MSFRANMKWIAVGVLSVLFAAVVHCGDGLASSEWTVTMDGRPSPVMFARAWRGEKAPDVDPGGDYGVLSFDWMKSVDLEVRTQEGRDLSTAAVRPRTADVDVVLREKDRVVVRVKRPCKFSIEPNEYERPLFVFADGPRGGGPSPAAAGVKAFGPGIHRVPGDVVRLNSGETLYLERGAVLQAAVYGKGDGIRIRGPGVIDATPWEAKKGPQFGTLRFRDAHNVTVEDVIVRGSYHWTAFVENCDGVTFRNVKICGGRCRNDDGIDIANSRNVTMTDCFFRTQDDCVAVKGLRVEDGPSERIRIERCLFSCSFARILAVGHESRAAYMKDIALDDCDVIHYVRPLLLVEPGDEMEISGVTFSNVRVHMDNHGRSEAVVRIQPVLNGYTKGPGKIRDVSISRVSFDGERLPLRFLVRGADDSHDVRDVAFSDLTWDGRKLDLEIVTFIDGRAASKDVPFDGEWKKGLTEPVLQVGPFVTNHCLNGRKIR